MPKGRMLNRSISRDERIARLSIHSAFLFTWMIPHADREGRMYAVPETIKGNICPLLSYFTLKRIKLCLRELETNNLCLIYGEGKYLLFNGFNKNQRIDKDREAPSEIPAPTELQLNSSETPERNSAVLLKGEVEVEVEVEGEGKELLAAGAAQAPVEKKTTKGNGPDHLFNIVVKYIYDTRLKKTGNKYIITKKLVGQLKSLCRVYTHAEVCAAWSVFINDELTEKDRVFWCSGYLPEKFTSQQCFSLCQESKSYKSHIKRHELERFGLQNIIIPCEVKSV